MIDEKKIKEAQKHIASYLEDGLLWKVVSTNKNIIKTYERNYKDSIAVATKLFDEGLSNLWIIVCSYYSMFYITNAILYNIGYKVGNKVAHQVTFDALVVLVRNRLKKNMLEDYEESKEEALDIIGRKTDEIIESFDRERDKRSIFQYEFTEEIEKAKAKTSLERAKRFIFEMKKLL